MAARPTDKPVVRDFDRVRLYVVIDVDPASVMVLLVPILTLVSISTSVSETVALAPINAPPAAATV